MAGVGAPRATASTRGARGDRDEPAASGEAKASVCLLSAVLPVRGCWNPGGGTVPSGAIPAGTGALKGWPKWRPCRAISVMQTRMQQLGEDCGFDPAPPPGESGCQPSLKCGRVCQRGGRRTEAQGSCR